jgi:predicted proteasome-type protease
LDVLVYRRDAPKAESRRITEDDPYFCMIHEGWSAALRDRLPCHARSDWTEWHLYQ